MANSRLITIEIDGEVNVHLPAAYGDYATICGLDGDDPFSGQSLIQTKQKAKLDCENCISIYNLCKSFNFRSL